MRKMGEEINVRKVRIELEAGKSKEAIAIEYNFKIAKIQSSNGTVKTFNLDYFWDRRAYYNVGRILFDDILNFLQLGGIEIESKGVDKDC